MTTERLNRVLFTLLGLVLAAAGAAILVAGLGVFPPMPADRPVIAPPDDAMLVTNDLWAWIAITVLGVATFVVGLWWLLAQFGVDRLRRLQLEPDRGRGGMQLSAGAFADAIKAELEQVPGVQSGRAHLAGRRGATELRLTARLSPYAETAEVRRHVETVVIPHARQVVTPDVLPTRLRLHIARSGQRAR